MVHLDCEYELVQENDGNPRGTRAVRCERIRPVHV